MTNQLINATSPYLLQHAHNPVNWYPWGGEALEKARSEDRPIFLSIGYAACHWCHVMAHESFENPEIAALLNERFVCIKVDREERPDLDSIYMSAVVALTGQGGWPMSVFLSPDLKPFYGGTYFPPVASHGLPSFKDLLLSLSTAWVNQRDDVTRAGQEIFTHLSDLSGRGKTDGVFTLEGLENAALSLMDGYDWDHGGWGTAPRFPHPMAIEFLIRRSLTGQKETLAPVVHLLKRMALGGIYDVVGGGFARYSTDADWRVPHFEKMLYDNAQLAQVYLHAWLVTGEPSFRRVVCETLDFVIREMLSPEGGFYSSLDADSDGEEGKFYVWTLAEIRGLLGKQSDFFEHAYGITAKGHWEGKTILQRAADDAALASRFHLSMDQVVDLLAECHALLYDGRSRRVHPGTDDKVLTAWNGLMLSTFAEAGRYLGEERYQEIAICNAEFLLTALRPDGKLGRSWRNGQVGIPVFLEDYAALILGLLDLYQTDFNPRWYREACGLAGEMIDLFHDPAGGFFDTPNNGEPLLVRPKDLQDNVTPSGNALAVDALLKLSELRGTTEWQREIDRAFGLATDFSLRYPIAFGRWLSTADYALSKVKQVAILGDLKDEQTQELIREVRRVYRPNLVVAASPFPPVQGAPELLADRPLCMGKPTAYVCQGFVCNQPVNQPEALRDLLEAL